MGRVILLTCEHASLEVPREWRNLFVGSERLLASHRGWDPGAHDLACYLQKKLKARLISGAYTRLLVDLNRDLDAVDLFSVKTNSLSESEKKQILKKYREPYWKKVQEAVAKEVRAGHEVLHISVHSFTPRRRGEVRTTDIGLLYNKDRSQERSFCKAWQKELQRNNSFQVDLNRPYSGTRTGPIPLLQRLHPQKYRGLELEINHKFLKKEKPAWVVKELVFKTLKNLI